MKQLILLSILCAFVMCSPKTAIKINDYEQLSSTSTLENHIEKKVAFVASRCKIEYQHMLKTTIEETSHYICLDAEIGQILAYYNTNTDIQKTDNIRFQVFGTLKKITGAGKGGKTHTEYYIELDYVGL